MKTTKFYLKPLFRKWVYGIAVAALGVAFVYKWVDAQQLAAWMVFAGAVIGMAFINVDPTVPSGMPEQTETEGENPTLPGL